MSDDVMLSIKGLTKTFGTFTAVDDLNIEVKKGSIHGFIGPNGAGKSTTMKMIVGMYRPTSGTGYVMGRNIGTKDALKLIGYSPERPPVYGNMTATNYLIYLGTISGLSLDEAERRTAELIEWLELSKFKNYDVGGFSAGMRQRIGLAQALVHNPELLILDEPTANLDPPGRMLIKDKLKELNQKENTTIFISSHILPELEQLVDSVTLIHKGKLMVEDTVERITQGFTEGIYLIQTSDNERVVALMKDKPHVKSINIIEGDAVSIHCSDPDALQYDLLKILTEEKIRLIRFGQETMNLEEIFSRSIGLKGASQ